MCACLPASGSHNSSENKDTSLKCWQQWQYGYGTYHAKYDQNWCVGFHEMIANL
jgi:hypothetical protein